MMSEFPRLRTAGWPFVCIILMATSVVIFQPGGLFRFVWIKIVVMVLAVAAGVLASRGAIIPARLKLLLALAACWILIAMGLAESPWASLAGRWPRYEGVLILCLYAALFFVGAKVLGGTDVAQRWQVLRLAVAVVAFVLLLVSGLEAAGLRPLGGGLDIRPGVTLGNATDQGLIGLVIAGILSAPGVDQAGGTWRLWHSRGGFCAAAIVVFLSGSRAALAGLGIVMVVGSVLWLRDRMGTARSAGAATLTALAVLSGGALLFPSSRDRLFSTGTVDGRWLLWERSLDLVGDHLWAGVGPSGFVDVLPGYLGQEWGERVGDSFPTDSPHNWPLQALAAGGIPLLLLVIATVTCFSFSTIRRIRNTPDAGDRRQFTVAFVAVGAYGVALLTHFTSPGTTGLVAFICGGLAGYDAVDRQVSRIRPVRGEASPGRIFPGLPKLLGLGLVAAGLAVAVPAAIAEWPMADGARSARLGDMDSADHSFRLALSLRPWDADTALLAAQAFAGPASDGDAAAGRRAVDWGTRSLKRNPDSVEAGMATAIGYMYSGDVGLAKDLLDGLLDAAPHSAGLLVQRGVANFGLGQAEDSIADLQHATVLDPAEDAPWRILAAVYERIGDAENARKAMERAEELAAD